jgi:hypothetical protein
MSEQIINILWNGEPEQDCGFNQVLRKIEEADEERFKHDHVTVTIAHASPLACATGDSLLQFAEEHGIIPTWIGMNDDK